MPKRPPRKPVEEMTTEELLAEAVAGGATVIVLPEGEMEQFLKETGLDKQILDVKVE